MDDFLKQLQLSDNAIKIYKECLGRPPLTKFELYSLVPSLSEKEFNKVLKELMETDLLKQILPQKLEILSYYIAIPPFTPILNYYSNIHTNLSNIEDSILGLFSSSLNRIFNENNYLQLENLHKNFNEIKKDMIEDSLIQKQDAKDILKEFERIQSNLKKNLYNFKLEQSKLLDNINEIAQTQFSDLIGRFSSIKTLLINNIKALDLKKREIGVLEVIEKIFKDEIRKHLEEFVLTTDKLIENEFKNFEESINKEKIEQLNNIIEKYYQTGNDINLLFLSALSNTEKNFNEAQKIIKEDRDNLIKNLSEIKEKSLENITEIMKDSMNQVSGLSKPIEDIMKLFLEQNISSYMSIIDQIWIIKSSFSLSEAIVNLISNSKEEVVIVIPKIEDYIKFEQFQNLPKNLRIKLISSEPHTNSLIKDLKEINNIEYRTFKNEKIIALKGDQNYISINILKDDSKITLDNVIGIGTNFQPLISILSPIIYTTWSTAEPDYSRTIKKTTQPAPIIEKTIIPENVPLKTPTNQQIKTELHELTHVKDMVPTQQTLPSENLSIQKEELKTNLIPQKKGDFISKISPKAGDSVGLLINTSFNLLISKLNSITGTEFSAELQNISDLILEKKGFSVTLHHIRSSINKFKENSNILTESEKMEIFNSIESWKKRLF